VTRLLLLLAAPLLMAQAEPKLVPDVSQREVEIRYSFTGAELLLFGAILYPGGRVPTSPADIVGVNNLQLSPGAGASLAEQRRFEAGLIDLMRRRQLYLERPGGVEITEGVLYRARLPIPARVPVGDYTAETFLIRDGKVLAAAVRDIRIEKLGFERFVADAAERWSLLYGLVAVSFSLLLGWGASAIFRRA
jgi:uncharacterized protein (TIGR02186 family)